MMVSTRGRYALRVMIDLAENNDGSFVPLKDIAKRQGISEKYLESVIAMLVKEKYLEGLRGKKGGYRLTKAPEEYTVRNILQFSEKSLAPVACLDCEVNSCERKESCKTLPMWTALNNKLNSFFDAITLKDLVEGTINAE
ncbi:MAG: RrF2 family transcriptional regulator [Firmicutes bacterium]|nr:RrF2 family transcriptional regulator [Bacillota bacterium]MBQ9604421.1 RrF2 family transcriptional regulator [Bacillota bacterium]